MTIINSSGQPLRPKSLDGLRLNTEAMPNGAIRLVPSKTNAPTGMRPFISFMADGTWMLQDAYGSTIMSNAEGNILIQPAGDLLVNANNLISKNKADGFLVNLTPTA